MQIALQVFGLQRSLASLRSVMFHVKQLGLLVPHHYQQDWDRLALVSPQVGQL
jgi:cytochrome c oxidase subunit IV